MAVEKNPFEKLEKVNTDVKEMTQGLPGVDVNVDPEQEEDVAVDVDPATGEVSVDLNENAGTVLASIKDFYGNLAEYMDEDTLTDLSTTVLDNFKADEESRQEWEQTFERGFDLLGLKLQETTEPFDGACTATHPLIIENAVKFQSKAAQELFPSKGPVKTQILGNSTPAKEQQAQRVKDYMNYQLTEEMPEYFDETERLLFHLPLIGTAIKKVYYDEALGRPISEFIPIDQFHVSNLVPDLRRADRYTHVIYRSSNDLKKDMNAGMYRDVEVGEPEQEERGMITAKAEQVMGLPGLSAASQAKVDQGNRMMKFCHSIFLLCRRLRIPIVVENPHSSRLWVSPPFLQIRQWAEAQEYVTDFCQWMPRAWFARYISPFCKVAKPCC